MFDATELTKQLFYAPFIDVINLAITLSQKNLALSHSEGLAKDKIISELAEIQHVISRITNNIKGDNPASVYQGLILLSCSDEKASNSLIEKLLNEIKCHHIELKDLYRNLNLPSSNILSPQSEPGPIIRAQITEKLRRYSLSDIILVYSDLQKSYDYLYENIKRTQPVLSFSPLISIIKMLSDLSLKIRNATIDEPVPQNFLGCISQSTLLVQNALNKLEHPSSNISQVLYYLKLAGLLLLQAIGINQDYYPAIVFASNTPDTSLLLTYQLIIQAINYHTNISNHDHIESLTKWCDLLLNQMMDEPEKISELFLKLANFHQELHVEIQKKRLDPNFQLGVVYTAYSLYELHPSLINSITELLIVYSKEDQHQYVKDYAKVCLLSLTEKNAFCQESSTDLNNKIKRSLSQSDYESYNEQKTNFFSQHKSLSLPNLTVTSWKEVFSDDIELFATIMHSQEAEPIEHKITTCLEKFRQREGRATLSAWGYDLIHLFKPLTANQSSHTSPAHTTLQQNVKFTHLAIDPKCVKYFDRQAFNDTLQAIFANSRNFLETGRISEGLQQYQETVATKQLPNSSMYIHDVVGTDLSFQKPNKAIQLVGNQINIEFVSSEVDQLTPTQIEADKTTIRDAFKNSYLLAEGSNIPNYLPEARPQKLEDYFIKLSIKRLDLLEGNMHSSLIASLSKDIHDDAISGLNEIFPSLNPQTSHASDKLRRQLLIGIAGSGKTTFCQYTAWRWACNQESPFYSKEFNEQYFLVIKLRLKRFQLTKYKTLYKKNIDNKQATVAEIIYEECLAREQKSSLMNQFSCNENELKTKVKNFLIASIFTQSNNGPHCLLLLDGLDEVITLFDQEDRSLVGEVLDYITTLETLNVFFTSRPILSRERLKRFKLERLLENKGFQSWHVNDYVKRYFQTEPKVGDSLLKQLQEAPKIATLVQTPLMLTLVCEIWGIQNVKTDSSNYSNLIKSDLIKSWNKGVTGLYQQLIQSFLLRSVTDPAKFKEMTTQQKGSYLANTYEHILNPLRLLALVGTRTNGCEFSPPQQEVIINQSKKPSSTDITFEDLEKTGLLRRIGYSEQDEPAYTIPHEFLHLTFQEWLSAWAICRWLSEEELVSDRLEEMIRHRYDRKWEWIWRFLVGLLYSEEGLGTIENKTVRARAQKRFLDLMHCQSRDYAGFGQMNLLAIFLEELSHLESNVDILPYYSSWKENWIAVMLGDDNLPKQTPFISALKHSLPAYPDLQAALTKEVLRRINNQDTTTQLEMIISLPLSRSVLVNNIELMTHLNDAFVHNSNDVDQLLLAIKVIGIIGYLRPDEVLSHLIQCFNKTKSQEVTSASVKTIWNVLKEKLSSNEIIEVTQRAKEKDEALLAVILKKLLEQILKEHDLEKLSNTLSKHLIKETENHSQYLPELAAVNNPLITEILNSLFSDSPETSITALWALVAIFPKILEQCSNDNAHTRTYLSHILARLKSCMLIDKEHNIVSTHILTRYKIGIVPHTKDYLRWRDLQFKNIEKIYKRFSAQSALISYNEFRTHLPHELSLYFPCDTFVSVMKQFTPSLIQEGLFWIEDIERHAGDLTTSSIQRSEQKQQVICWLLKPLSDWLSQLVCPKKDFIFKFLVKLLTSYDESVQVQARATLLALATNPTRYILEYLTNYFIKQIVIDERIIFFQSFKDYVRNIQDSYSQQIFHYLVDHILSEPSHSASQKQQLLEMIGVLPKKSLAILINRKVDKPNRKLSRAMNQLVYFFSTKSTERQLDRVFEILMSIESIRFKDIKCIFDSVKDQLKLNDNSIHKILLTTLHDFTHQYTDDLEHFLNFLIEVGYLKKSYHHHYSTLDKIASISNPDNDLKHVIIKILLETNLKLDYTEIMARTLEPDKEIAIIAVLDTILGNLGFHSTFDKELIEAIFSFLFNKYEQKEFRSVIMQLFCRSYKRADSLSKVIMLLYFYNKDINIIRDINPKYKLDLLDIQSVIDKLLTKSKELQSQIIKPSLEFFLFVIDIFQNEVRWQSVLSTARNIAEHAIGRLLSYLQLRFSHFHKRLRAYQDHYVATETDKATIWAIVKNIYLHVSTDSWDWEKFWEVMRKEKSLEVLQHAWGALLSRPEKCLEKIPANDLISEIFGIIEKLQEKNIKIDHSFIETIKCLLETKSVEAILGKSVIQYYLTHHTLEFHPEMLDILILAYKKLEPKDIFGFLRKGASSKLSDHTESINLLLMCPDGNHIVNMFIEFIGSGEIIDEQLMRSLKREPILLIKSLIHIYELDRQQKAKADIKELVRLSQLEGDISNQFIAQTVLYQYLSCVWHNNTWLFFPIQGIVSLESKSKLPLLCALQKSIGFFRRRFTYPTNTIATTTFPDLNYLNKLAKHSHDILKENYTVNEKKLMLQSHINTCASTCFYLNINGCKITDQEIDLIIKLINKSKLLRKINLSDNCITDSGLLRILQAIQHTMIHTVEISNNKIHFNQGELFSDILLKLPYLRLVIDNIFSEGKKFITSSDLITYIKKISKDKSKDNAIEDDTVMDDEWEITAEDDPMENSGWETTQHI